MHPLEAIDLSVGMATPPPGADGEEGRSRLMLGARVPSSARLVVSLLGSPVVVGDGQPLAISRRKVRALLYLLAAASNPLPRERLSFLFWADIRESEARRNLTGLLSHLRRALPDPDLLLAEDDQVWIERGPVWSDVLALEDLYANQSQLLDPVVFRHMVGQYRGAFLSGVSLPDSPEFEAWVTSERTKWEQRHLTALSALIDHEAAAGEHRAAIELAQRYLDVDDLAEDIHRHLIELYTILGDRNHAVRQYKRCVEILERELGVEPLPETRAAYRAALEGSPVAVAVPSAKPAWAAMPIGDIPLVGREDLMSGLESAFSRAQGGQGALVLLSGEPGVGKTRVMSEFAHRLEGRALQMYGAGYPDSRWTPYQPLVDALRPGLTANPSWLELADCCLDELALLLPELRQISLSSSVDSGRRRPTSTIAGAGSHGRTRLFEALSRLVLGLASGPLPVVLFLDDLHWADSNTTDWLGFLGRRLGGERLLVVGGYNSEEREWASALRGTLMPSGVVSDFSLGRLDPDEIDQILRHVGESLPADEELAELLFQATGGNPFYLLETLHALAEATCDVDDLAGMMSFCLPDIVREAAEGRLSRLDPVARQVLEAGAVLGLAFTFDEVHLTGGRSEIETMDGLDGLVARQLLDEEPARYRFRHEVIRAAAYRSLGHGRRRLLHRRAGEALERLRVGDPAALSRHSEQADKLGQAAFYALEAGRAAKAVFAHEEARTHFDRALVLLETEAAEIRRPDDVAANQHRQIEALYERGWVFRLLGAMDAYVADLEQEARLAESLGDPATLAHLRFRQASAHRWFCRYERARAIAKEGLAFSQEAGDPLLEAYCLREIGLAARELGAYGPAQSALEAAQTILADLQETVLELHVMGNLSSLHLYRGEYEESLALAERALALCDRAGLPLERRLPLGDIGAAAGALGHLASAQEALEESLRIAQRTSDRTQEIFCDLHLGWLSVRRQRPQAALDALHAGLELAEQVGSCAEQSALHSGLAEAYRLAGKRATARHHAERALQLARSRGCAYDELLARDVLQRLGAASA